MVRFHLPAPDSGPLPDDVGVAKSPQRMTMPAENYVDSGKPRVRCKDSARDNLSGNRIMCGGGIGRRYGDG